MIPESELPDNILVEIFSYFKQVNEVTVLRFVCRRWNEIILNFWSKKEQLTLTKYLTDENQFKEYAESNARLHPRLKAIKFDLEDSTGEYATTAEVPKHYSYIGKVMPNIEQLTFNDTPIDDDTLEAIVKSCPNLKILCLYSCPEVHGEGLGRILKEKPLLHELELIGCPEADPSFVDNCKNIKSLVFEECSFDDESWKKLSEVCGKTLEKLAFSPISYETVCLVSKLFPALKTFFLGEIDDTEETLHFDEFEGFPKLETMILTFGSVSGIENLMKILSKSPKIKTFWLWECENRSAGDFLDQVMEKFSESIKHVIIDSFKTRQLDKLSFKNFHKVKKITIIGSIVPKDFLKRLIESCYELNYLDISDSVPPEEGIDTVKTAIRPSRSSLWLSIRQLSKPPQCARVEPPFRNNYKNNDDVYDGPVLTGDKSIKPRLRFGQK